MYIPWEWIKEKTNCGKDYSIERLVEELNYNGLECEKNYTKNDLFINFVTAHNRKDLRSWWGISREIRVLLNLGKENSITESGKIVPPKELKILVESRKVIEYNAAVFSDVDNTNNLPSWITNSLIKNGIRSLTPIVDLTNFVTLETGQPLHAFDLEKIRASSPKYEIVVGEAIGGEPFVDLSGKERKLVIGDLVTKVNNKVIELVGIIGGIETAIEKRTNSIMIESARFLAESIEKTANQLGIQTKASKIFTDSCSFEKSENVIRRFEELLRENCNYTGREREQFSFPERVQSSERKHLKVNISFIESKLGVVIPNYLFEKTLERLDFSFVNGENGFYTIEISNSRPDVETKEDIVEEVGKLLDYNKLAGKLPSFRNEFVDPQFNTEYITKRKLALYLISTGYQEVISYSLVGKDATLANRVSISNPKSTDRINYRLSFVNSHLEIIKHNQRQGNQNISIFEMGYVYKDNGNNEFEQEELLSIAVMGKFVDSHVHQISYLFDSYWAKGLVENIGTIFGTNLVVEEGFSNQEQESCYPILLAKERVGLISELSKKHLQKNGIESASCFVIELSLGKLFSIVVNQKKEKYSHISYLPIIVKNISFIVEKRFSLNQILTLVREESGELLLDASLFDIYEKQKEGSSHSLNVKLLFQGKKTNLQNTEIEAIIERIWKILEEKFSVLRR